ncbi:MAG: hypothetical protein B6U94_04045 [Thermofilum sp. ex4484_79]|nr:MAG: hypothetical protein B6U94_04045 [Thermofilum sp. ex4484_79]
MELAKEKAEMRSAGILRKRTLRTSEELYVSYSLQKWKKLISSIDEASSSLTIDKEISFLE